MPTLFFGRLVAAYVVPPSATSNAINDTTNAGLGALKPRFCMTPPPRVLDGVWLA